MTVLSMTPAAGERLLRYVGDRLVVTLAVDSAPSGSRAFLRTNLTRAKVARTEVIARARVRLAGEAPFAGESWRDIPFTKTTTGFELDLPLLEVGFFHAKAYFVEPSGRQVWPDGPDIGISVHPDSVRTRNLVYCAFPRAFGAAARDVPAPLSRDVRALDDLGFTVIPPSGTLRDVTRAVPHVMDVLGFRALHLLPLGPVPTTHARMGRYGSPYAALDLTSIDAALVEHDRRTNSVDQFRELADAVHARDGMMILDVVLNHTGWESQLFEEHPEWFLRAPDGTFKSPGAWGNTWADLVELDQRHVDLWHVLADSLVTWCRRGIDGFRCDAGYMVPVPAWQFVIAQVRTEFPDCIFFLEGLGGAWEATEALLTDGGMQWAYSELFQNYSGEQVSGYLDHAIRQSARVGLLLHYAETHDNDRLAKKGRTWSLLRNRLSALASVSGGYAITAGVEWLETAKIDVHEGRPLGFGNSPNIVEEIRRLTRLLSDHPCFADGATLARVSAPSSPVVALERRSRDGADHCLVLANLDPDEAQVLELDGDAWLRGGEKTVDLLGGAVPKAEWVRPNHVAIRLEAASVSCLASSANAVGLRGDEYRRKRAQAAWALSELGAVLPHEKIGAVDFEALAAFVSEDPAAFLGSLGRVVLADASDDLLGSLRAARDATAYSEVVVWTALDARRVTLVPPEHWLLVIDPKRFEIDLEVPGLPRRIRSTEMAFGHVVAIPPSPRGEKEMSIRLDRYDANEVVLDGRVHILGHTGTPTAPLAPTADQHVLLTNGRGGMARLSVDLGHVTSKYDCLLGANLDPEFPCDRHVFVKRMRAWLNADGFITALDAENRIDVEAGPPAVFRFAAHAGDGRRVRVDLSVAFVPNENTVLVRFTRKPSDGMDTLQKDREVKITVRFDLEDRGYHDETHANPETDAHFVSHTARLIDRTGFEFVPASDRRLEVVASGGTYHAAAEWSIGLFHAEEATRGLPDHGDGFSPGWFEAPLGDEPLVFALSAEPKASAPPVDLWESLVARDVLPRSVRPGAARNPLPKNAFITALRRATQAFIARRGAEKTVIAGYPWFLDWGRDALIAARGLFAGGFVDEARSVVRTFARFEDRGTLPNFLSGRSPGSRESSDAPLWFALACDEYAGRAGDRVLAERVDDTRSLADVLRSIAVHYLAGTDNGVAVDPDSALVFSPSHFTWMDTNHPAGTPREGYPIELAALFFRLTSLLERIGAPAPGPATTRTWRELANHTRDSLSLYYLPSLGYFADTLHAAAGTPARAARPDDHLRPNQLFAVSLGVVEGARAQSAVAQAARYLLVPGALRTLAPRPVEFPLAIMKDGRLLNDPGFPYAGRYEGDEDTRRKPAYHNGTAWPWLMPTYAEAIAKAYDGDASATRAARAVLGSAANLLFGGTLGQLPEILDGDAPHTRRGCDAQAWSVTEALRVAVAFEETE